MFRTFDIKIPIILVLNLCYLYILTVVNSEIAPYIYIMLPAIFIVPAAFLLGFLPMLFVVGFSALIFEADMPIRTGLVCALWIFCAYFVRKWRMRFRNLDTFSVISLMLLLNFFILCIYTLFLPNGCISGAAYFYRAAIDISVSSAVLIFAAKIAVTLPISIVKLLGADISIEEGE